MNADTVRLFVRAQQVMVEVEGMKAENARCVVLEQVPSYAEAWFKELASALGEIEKELSNANDA